MHRDPHAMRIAWRIEHQLAPAIVIARTALEARIARLNGWNTITDDPHVTTSTSGSSTERHATQRAQLTADHQQLHDDLRDIDRMVSDIIRMCGRMTSGIDTPTADLPDVPVCMEGLAGKDGSIVWGDPTCAMPAVRKGLCQAHWMAYYRHLRDRGVDVTKHHEPAA